MRTLALQTEAETVEHSPRDSVRDWEKLPLSHFGRFQSGNGFPLKFQGQQTGDYPFFKVSDMNNDGNSLFMTNANHWIDEDTRKSLGATIIPAGSIVFAKIGAAIFLERKRILSQASCIDNNMMAFIPNSPNLSQRFFHYTFLRTDLGKLVSATALPSLSSRDIGAICYEFPKDDEQRAIAEALSDADALIASLDALIAKKRDLKQAAMQQLLTGKTRLSGFNDDWRTITLFEVCGSQKALFDDGDWIEAEHITDSGIRLIQTGNIGIGSFQEKEGRKFVFEESFEKLRCKQIFPGDLLICRLAEPAGRACIMPDIGQPKMVTSVDVTIARPNPDSADRRFLSYVMSTSDWFKAVSDRSGGTTHKRIARGALGRIELRLPQPEEQSAVADVLSDMDAELAALETARDKARAIKQGMMQELLTGRIRLV